MCFPHEVCVCVCVDRYVLFLVLVLVLVLAFVGEAAGLDTEDMDTTNKFELRHHACLRFAFLQQHNKNPVCCAFPFKKFSVSPCTVRDS